MGFGGNSMEQNPLHGRVGVRSSSPGGSSGITELSSGGDARSGSEHVVPVHAGRFQHGL